MSMEGPYKELVKASIDPGLVKKCFMDVHAYFQIYDKVRQCAAIHPRNVFLLVDISAHALSESLERGLASCQAAHASMIQSLFL